MTSTVAIGFGPSTRTAALNTAHGQPRPAASPTARNGIRRRLGRAYLAGPCGRCPAQRHGLGDGVERLGHGARGERGQDGARWLRRLAGSPVGAGRTRCRTSRSTTRSGRRDLYQIATGLLADRRRRRGEPRARLPVERAAARGRVLPAEHAASTARPSSATCRWTRWRSRSCWPTSSVAPAAPDWAAREEVGGLRGRRTDRQTKQERWENATGCSPATIAAEIAGLVCAADIATQERRHRVGASPYLSRRPMQWQSDRSRRWTATTTGTVQLRRRTTCASPRHGHPDSGDHDAGLRRGAADRRAEGRRPELPRPRPARREAGRRPGGHATRSTVVDDAARSYQSRRNGRFWHRASFDGYGEQRDGTPVGAHRRRVGQHPSGRGWPLLGRRARRVRADRRQQAGRRAPPSRLDTMGRAAADASHLMAGAGLGRLRTRRRIRTRVHARRADALGDPAGLDARAVPAARGQRSTPAAPIETPQVVACRYDSEACTG